MADFDTSRNHFIEKGEFVNGMLRWLDEAKRTVTSGAYSKKFLNDFHAVCFFYQLFCCRVDLSWKDKFQLLTMFQRTRDEQTGLLDKDEEEGEADGNPTWTCIKAILLLLLGTAMAAASADPLVDAVHNFSNATHIPSFFISFIVMPLATNSSEAVSAIIFASRKKKRTLSLTFSEVCLLSILYN